MAETQKFWLKNSNFFMFNVAPDQRVPKLVTVRLPSLEVNRKGERNRVIFFIIHFSSEMHSSIKQCTRVPGYFTGVPV